MLNARTGQRLSRSLLYLDYEMVALLESFPQRGLSAIRKTGMAHQKRFSHRWPPQSQRPTQMRSLVIGCEPGGLLSAKLAARQR